MGLLHRRRIAPRLGIGHATGRTLPVGRSGICGAHSAAFRANSRHGVVRGTMASLFGLLLILQLPEQSFCGLRTAFAR